jgi:hypothetical protein
MSHPSVLVRSALGPVVCVTAALASLVAAPAFAAAPANTFSIVSSAGKNVGNAGFTITKDKNGYHLVGKFQYHFAATVGVDLATGNARTSVNYNEGQYNEDFKVSEAGNFISGYTQNSSDQMMTSFQPIKGSSDVSVNQIQAGAGQAHTVTMNKSVFQVVPDYDPGALQLFLTTSIAHPHDDKIYLFLVPAGSTSRGHESPIFVTLQLAPDTPEGTLDGKPVKMMHYVMGYHVGKADLYTDDAGNLMQANMDPLGVNYVRAKFALTTPAATPAPAK